MIDETTKFNRAEGYYKRDASMGNVDGAWKNFVARAKVQRSEMDNFNTPDLDQGADSILRPGETLEDDFDVTFRKANSEGGFQQLVKNTDNGSRPGYAGSDSRLNETKLKEPYLFEYDTPSGEKRYQAKIGGSGYSKTIRRAFPHSKEGKQEALDTIKDFLSKPENKREEGIRKMDNPPNPKKPWKYKTYNAGTHYFSSQKEAEDFKQKRLDNRTFKQTKLPTTEFDKIVDRIKKGETLDVISKDYGLKDASRIRKLLLDNNITYSQLTPNSSYVKDLDLQKQFIDNYKKLSVKNLSSKLFPEDTLKVAQQKYDTLRDELKKTGKLKISRGYTDELKESFSDEPKDLQAKRIRKVRDDLIKEVSDLDFERKLREGKKGTGLDQAHRLSLKQVKKTNELYNVLNLGIDAPDINREIIQSYEDDLSKLYSKQNSIVKQAEKFDKVPKNISLELSKINKQISEVVAKTKGRLQGVHIDEFTLKPKTTGVNYINSIGMGLIDKDVKNLNQADIDLAKAIMPYQVENEKKIMGTVKEELIKNKSDLKNLMKNIENTDPKLAKKVSIQLNSGLDPLEILKEIRKIPGIDKLGRGFMKAGGPFELAFIGLDAVNELSKGKTGEQSLKTALSNFTFGAYEGNKIEDINVLLNTAKNLNIDSTGFNELLELQYLEKELLTEKGNLQKTFQYGMDERSVEKYKNLVNKLQNEFDTKSAALQEKVDINSLVKNYTNTTKSLSEQQFDKSEKRLLNSPDPTSGVVGNAIYDIADYKTYLPQNFLQNSITKVIPNTLRKLPFVGSIFEPTSDRAKLFDSSKEEKEIRLGEKKNSVLEELQTPYYPKAEGGIIGLRSKYEYKK